MCRSWVYHVTDERQERARQQADQQRLAEQHHRQVLVKGMWEGLGQAVALRRIALRDAHRHFQLYHQHKVLTQRACMKICLLCISAVDRGVHMCVRQHDLNLP